MSFSTHHISYLERAFLDGEQMLNLHKAKWLAAQADSFHLVQITSVPRLVASVTNEELGANEVVRMANVFAGIHGLNDSVVYGIIGEATEVKLFMATCQHEQFDQNNLVLPAILHSAYPGITIRTPPTNIVSKWQNRLYNFPYTAIVTGTPTLKIKPNSGTDQPIDHLIRALYGTQWAYIVVARPMALSDLQELCYSTLNELRLITNVEQSASSVSPIAEKYKQILNWFWEKLRSGKCQGMWHTIAYLLADDWQTLSRAKAVGLSVFSGELSVPDPIRILNVNGINGQVMGFALPMLPPPQAPGKVQYPFQYLSLLSSAEMAAMIHLPTQEVFGFFVREQARFDVTPHYTSADNNGIQIGEIINQEQYTGVHYTIDRNSLTRHTMIVGTTGSGKTNTIFCLLRQLVSHGVPFLVIEPAKTEYRALLESDIGQYLQVFTLGSEMLSPFRLNPFEILPGVSVQTHIDHLKSVFNASFVMYAPMPYVLERCIYEVYEDKGWDLVTSQNRRDLHPCAYPTLSDLYGKIDEVVDYLGYESKVTMDIKAALKTRINSLRIGAKGLMLDTHASVPIATLLHKPTILELDHLGDDEEKAFLIGLILIFLYEYYRSTGHTESGGLKHVTVVEEAHRLLKKTPPATDLETANMAGKAVESFSNILAEIRTYGEGIIVAEQIPSKLTSDIIKNTNLKIVHRLIAEDDRLLTGGAIGLEPKQIRWLGSCALGEAAVFSDGDDSPIRVKIPYKKIEQATTGSHSDQKVRDAMEAFQADHQWCFHLYPWSIPFDSALIKKYHNECRRIVDNQEFQEAFARYALSGVLSHQVLLNEFSALALVIRKHARQNDSSLLKTVLIYGIDWLIGTRGRQNGIAYNDLPTLKRMFASILLNYVLPSQKHSAGKSHQTPQQSERVATFQTEYKRNFTSKTCPFIGCDRVCASGGCLYRYNVTPLVQDERLYGNFRDALADSPGSDLWQRVADVSRTAVRRIISDGVPAEEKSKVALCFAIQAGEAMPTLDDWLKEKLITGLLPLFIDREEVLK